MFSFQYTFGINWNKWLPDVSHLTSYEVVYCGKLLASTTFPFFNSICWMVKIVWKSLLISDHLIRIAFSLVKARWGFAVLLPQKAAPCAHKRLPAVQAILNSSSSMNSFHLCSVKFIDDTIHFMRSYRVFRDFFKKNFPSTWRNVFWLDGGKTIWCIFSNRHHNTPILRITHNSYQQPPTFVRKVRLGTRLVSVPFHWM